MYVEFVPNRNSRPAILLREGTRRGQRVIKRTLANLTHWPEEKVDRLRRLLKDEPLIGVDDAFCIERSFPHGHVEAILGTIKKLGVDKLISARRSRERGLVVAMITQRLIKPRSKLETTRLWKSTSLAEEIQVVDADEEELYAAMDWLLERQTRIEKKLAARHLKEGGLALYDVTSSYYEGHVCSLAQHGHNRDGKKGKPIIVYGLMVDGAGRPISLEVYEGNTGDPTTVSDQVEKLREQFGLERMVLVGDRGMLTQTQIEMLKEHPGLGWISALRSTAIRKLVDSGSLQLSLFDKRNLAEISSPEFPAERLVVCYNPILAEQRRRKREELLAVTERDLRKIVSEVQRRTKKPLPKVEIAKKVGQKLGRYKMGKHFQVKIEDGSFSFLRHEDKIRKEAELDGIYIIRTSEKHLSADDVVRNYKNLSQAERAFRCFKGVDLRVRPIFHYLEDRVRAHIFLCMLAYYVEWHMRRSLAPLLFEDKELEEEKKTRDPVAPAESSSSAREKQRTKRTIDDFPVHSYESLLDELATRCKHRCRFGEGPKTPLITRYTIPTPLQLKAFQLLGVTCSQ